jgi:hypothetical protein
VKSPRCHPTASRPVVIQSGTTRRAQRPNVPWGLWGQQTGSDNPMGQRRNAALAHRFATNEVTT